MQLEEWEQDPTPAQLALLEGVREVARALLRELARTNRLDTTELLAAADDPAGRPVDRAMRQQLEPLWHTLSWRSRCVRRQRLLHAVQAARLGGAAHCCAKLRGQNRMQPGQGT